MIEFNSEEREELLECVCARRIQIQELLEGEENCKLPHDFLINNLLAEDELLRKIMVKIGTEGIK